MLNILLTGANGFLGRIIFNELSKTYNVNTLGRKNSNYNCDLSSGVPVFNEPFDIVVHAEESFHTFFKHSALKRTQFKGIKRNILFHKKLS